MIGLDTNILIRYLTQDDPVQSPKATQVIEHRLSPTNMGFVSVVTMAEIVWVLDRAYGLTNREIAAAVERSIGEKRIAGAVTLVSRRGRVAWLKAQGMMDREAAKPMQTDALFRICSMTKAITSLAVMMLYEEGHFLLDDPVSKYIPEFKNPKVLIKPASGQPYTIPATKEITVRNLLTHTSGLTYNWNPNLGAMYKDANVAHGLLPYDGTIQDPVRG